MFETAVVCDKCDKRKVLWNKVIPAKDATRLARGDGWSIGKKILCENCKAEKKENKDA